MWSRTPLVFWPTASKCSWPLWTSRLTQWGSYSACVLLHNIMLIRYPVLQNRLVDYPDLYGNMQPDAWREGIDLEDTRNVKAPNRASKEGKKQRNFLPHWCNSPAGMVPWQDRMVDLPWWDHMDHMEDKVQCVVVVQMCEINLWWFELYMCVIVLCIHLSLL